MEGWKDEERFHLEDDFWDEPLMKSRNSTCRREGVGNKINKRQYRRCSSDSEFSGFVETQYHQWMSEIKAAKFIEIYLKSLHSRITKSYLIWQICYVTTEKNFKGNSITSLWKSILPMRFGWTKIKRNQKVNEEVMRDTPSKQQWRIPFHTI